LRYITLQEALHVHEVLLEAYGGASGVRNMGLIESALLRPRTGYYADVIEEAAALWESLSMNYGFVDGNKRVAFACTEIFLDLNVFSLTATEDDTIAFINAHLESGTFTKDNLAAWLRVNSIAR
jgi:death-on-curing protein